MPANFSLTLTEFMKIRAKRYLGTFYCAGTLFSPFTCGHRHATVRAAMKCKRKIYKGRIFMAHLGMLPAKILD